MPLDLLSIMLLLAPISISNPLQSSNLLANGNFESSLADSWDIHKTSGVNIQRDRHNQTDGGYCLEITNSASTNTDYYGCTQLVQAIKEKACMTLRAQIKHDNLHGTAGIDVHFLDAQKERLPIYDTKISEESHGGHKTWEYFSVDFRIPPKTEYIRVAIFIKGVGSAWFDEVSLETCSANAVTCVYPSRGAYIIKDQNPLIWFEFAEQKIFPDTPPPRTEIENKIVIQAARNENESFQISIMPEEDVHDCSIEFTDLTNTVTGNSIKSTYLSSYYVGFVNVQEASTAVGFPGLHADFLINSDRYDLAANRNNPIYVSLRVPYNLPPGTYEGSIIIKNNSNLFVRIPLELKIWSFIISEQLNFIVRSNFWLSLIKKYDHRNNEGILADYYQNLREHRVNALATINIKTEVVGDSVICFFDDFGRRARILFENYGFNAITVGPFIGDAAGWQYRRKWMGVDPESTRFEHLLRQYCKKLDTYLYANGWTDRCWISYWDEPRLDDPDFERIVRIGKIIKQTAPNLKIFMTKWPVPQLFGIVDIWCLPFTQRDFRQQDVTERKNKGEKILVYHNDPYIDTPLIDKRLYAWRYRLAAVDGAYAWWNLTFWQANPYEYTSQVERKGQKDNILKPGDGVLLYPNPTGNGPPVNSLRWQAFLQGLEDYAYFTMLEETIDQAMRRLKFIEGFSDYPSHRINEYLNMVIINYFHTWTRDVQYLYYIRTCIAEEIQRIEETPIILIKTQPPEGHAQANQTINIMGLTEQGTEVSINNNVVLVNNKGFFNTKVIRPSDGIITIKAKLGSNTKIFKRQF